MPKMPKLEDELESSAVRRILRKPVGLAEYKFRDAWLKRYKALKTQPNIDEKEK